MASNNAMPSAKDKAKKDWAQGNAAAASTVVNGPPKRRSAPARIWSRLREIDLNPETAFKRKRPPPCPRSVYFNQPLPAEAFTHKGVPLDTWTFASNQVLTAKYTLYNFIFKNLLEQFRRVANIFFLVLIILQFFPKFYTISPGLAMLPLLVVLGITALKDGYEDVKRHQSDRHINRIRVRTLIGGGWANPNAMEANSRSITAQWTIFYNRFLGGRKRKNEKIREHHDRRRSMSFAERASTDQPIAPPADAPGGGAAPLVESSGHAAEPSTNSLRPTPSRTLTRQTTIGGQSLFDGEYEVNADGHVFRNGVRATAEEEAEYYAKKAPRWKSKMWEDLAVGDFVLLKNNDPIPADILICSTSEEEDTCFIETKNLDGETNLKSRHAVPELAVSIRTPADCAAADFRIDAEPQDTNMYRLNASVVLSDQFDKEGQPLRCPVTLNQILLRGCNVRNTDWVIGVVLMTGADTKIIANSGNTPSKRGKVERQMNPMVYINLSILAIICIGCAIADARIENHFYPLGAYWEYGANLSDDNPNINGLVTFGNALITFQNIVPISLYISIEFVRTIQAYFIYDDHDIYYEKTERRTTARSWNLSDDLGQIEYIFSDKTGTLTQNLMIFREFCVGGIVYSGNNAAQDGKPSSANEKDDLTSESSKSADLEPGRKRVKPSTEGVAPFADAEMSATLRRPDDLQAVALGRFFRCLALCHTVLTAEVDGVLEYKAQSPDEQALVQAAADSGFVFCGKDKNVLTIQCPGSLELERYELLTVLEFSSARKRMSIIVRRQSDGQVLLLSKGADSVIFERSAEGQQEIKDRTDDALEEFANNGLRTLCLAYKELLDEDYEDWAHHYHEASVALEQREERMEDLASALERDLVLLGATAIEDRLQDGVPETIADLKRAGINVWVATGDKLETAIAIGYSTMLLSRDMNLIVVRGGEYGSPNSAYEQLKKAVERFFGGEEELASMKHQPPGAGGYGAVHTHSRTSSAAFDEDAPGAVPGGQAQRPRLDAARNSTISHASLVGEDNGQRTGGYALVIDGAALGHALSEEFSKDLLLAISTKCKAVICCRVSPLQKALIVRLIKDGLGVMTLAIGDGANDVSMIQAAHVGIGIAGEEGLQAVNSSDYAIAQFRFLKRLLLVHGHWSYYRNGTMISNFFYKEIINISYLFWFQIYCIWSSTQALDYVYLLLWNAFWTVAAVIGIGIFDRNISDRVLMEVPELYRRGREGKYFGLGPFFICMLDGLWQGTVLYFFICYAYDYTTARSDGYDIQLYEWTTTMAIASVLLANLTVGVQTRAWTWWIVFAVFIGPLLIWIFAPIYAAFSPTSPIWTYSYGNNHYLYASANFWFSGPLCIVLAILPRLIFLHVRTVYFPTDIDILRIVDKVDPKHDYLRDPAMPTVREAHHYDVDVQESGDAGGVSAAPGSGLPGGRREESFGMHSLQPTASRASSTHYDMLTGTHTPNRGYSFSAQEPDGRRGAGYPSDPSQKRKPSLKERLIPASVRRKREQAARKRMTLIAQGDDEEEAGDAATGANAQQSATANAGQREAPGQAPALGDESHDGPRWRSAQTPRDLVSDPMNDQNGS